MLEARSLEKELVHQSVDDSNICDTIDARALGLTAVREGIMRWAWGSVHAWWRMALHVAWHTWLTCLLLWRRGQTRPTLITSHDTLEQIRRAMPYRWRWLLRWAYVRTLWWASSLLELVSEACDLVFIPVLG